MDWDIDNKLYNIYTVGLVFLTKSFNFPLINFKMAFVEPIEINLLPFNDEWHLCFDCNTKETMITIKNKQILGNLVEHTRISSVTQHLTVNFEIFFKFLDAGLKTFVF